MNDEKDNQNFGPYPDIFRDYDRVCIRRIYRFSYQAIAGTGEPTHYRSDNGGNRSLDPPFHKGIEPLAESPLLPRYNLFHKQSNFIGLAILMDAESVNYRESLATKMLTWHKH